MIQIYNSLTRKKEDFKPRKKDTVNMYACGVTVYDDCHIGHGRSLYVFEVIRRYLRFRGFKVNFVRNITDVDDKIINKARALADEKDITLKEAFDEVRQTYINSYRNDLELLAIPRADIEPLATENIADMQKFIAGLIGKGYAYQSEGNVYFSVRKFSSYGKLSGKKIDDLFSSVRIEADPNKKDPLDFALWKKAKEDEPFWDSPWGKGRPGWHIECSVMSRKYLKTDTLDIHGGGRDLIFPHHENELTQSESLTAKTFVNYWIHHGLLTIESQKMAKSLGNFITIKDVLNKYPADVLKLFYLGAHYSSSIDFSWEKMEEAKKAYERIDILRGKLSKISKQRYKNCQPIEKFKKEFTKAMDDDFNMSKALGVLFEAVNECNRLFEGDDKEKDKKLICGLDLIREITDIFAFTFTREITGGISDEQIEEKVNLRLRYKKKKDFKQADNIRQELEKQGIILEDTKNGITWRRKL